MKRNLECWQITILTDTHTSYYVVSNVYVLCKVWADFDAQIWDICLISLELDKRIDEFTLEIS